MRNQKLLRSENYKSLDDAIRRGDIDPTDPVGKRVVLPSTFVGSPRYMVQNYQDVMAICKVIGYPELTTRILPIRDGLVGTDFIRPY